MQRILVVFVLSYFPLRGLAGFLGVVSTFEQCDDATLTDEIQTAVLKSKNDMIKVLTQIIS